MGNAVAVVAILEHVGTGDDRAKTAVTMVRGMAGRTENDAIVGSFQPSIGRLVSATALLWDYMVCVFF